MDDSCITHAFSIFGIIHDSSSQMTHVLHYASPFLHDSSSCMTHVAIISYSHLLFKLRSRLAVSLASL
jgi:hypothetical protein